MRIIILLLISNVLGLDVRASTLACQSSLTAANLGQDTEAAEAAETPEHPTIHRPNNTWAQAGRHYRDRLPQGYTIDIAEDEPRELTDARYTFINHAGTGWDRTEEIKPGVAALVALSKRHAIPVIGSVGHHCKQPFFAPADASFVMQSSAGAHSLKFPNAEAFLFAGGGFSECLGETIRESIRGSDPSKPLKIFLVSDAIYSGDFPDRSWTLDSYAKNNEIGLIHAWIEGLLVDYGSVFGAQTTPSYAQLPSADFQFLVYLGKNRLIRPMGNGPRKIDIVIVNSQELDSVFEKFSDLSQAPIR